MVPSADGMAVAPLSGGCWRRTVPSSHMVGKLKLLHQEGTLIDVYTWNNKRMAIDSRNGCFGIDRHRIKNGAFRAEIVHSLQI